jgi:hypothetical protein
MTASMPASPCKQSDTHECQPYARVLYVQAGNSTWEYRGCVSNTSPSEVFPLQWWGCARCIHFYP